MAKRMTSAFSGRRDGAADAARSASWTWATSRGDVMKALSKILGALLMLLGLLAVVLSSYGLVELFGVWGPTLATAVGHIVECVVPAAMGVARVIGDFPQLPEYRHVDRCPEGRLELVDGGDPLAAQQGHEAVRMELNGSHSVRPPALVLKSDISLGADTEGSSTPHFSPSARIFEAIVHDARRRERGSVTALCQMSVLAVVFYCCVYPMPSAART